MTKHLFEHHAKCEKEYCSVCDGGLSICVTCKLAEGTLTTHCPGDVVTAQAEDDIYQGLLDYVDGQWTSTYGL